MKCKARIVPVVLLTSGLFLTGNILRGAISPSTSPTDPPDPKIVQEKIILLGLRDDSLPWQEKPEYWLKIRQEMIIPELIKGLDSSEKRVAKGCLRILEKISNRPEILDSLVQIARNEKHIINHETSLSLCQFPQDPRVPQIMKQALAGDRFPDPRERSRIAEAAGRKDAAANHLIPLLKRNKHDSDMERDIQRLGDIGHSVAIDPLVELTKDFKWHFAEEAYFALAKIDSQNYGLTKDQQEFLKQAGRGFKANRETYVKHWKTIALLNQQEIRPYVLHMLKTDNSSASLTILQEWNDKDALPEIRQQILSQRNLHFGEFVAAYLNIEGTDNSIEEMISIFKKIQRTSSSSYGRTVPKHRPRELDPNEFYYGGETEKYQYHPFSTLKVMDIIRGIYRSEMTQQRKLRFLLRFREYFGEKKDIVGRKYALEFPRNIMHHKGNQEILLKGLMQHETYLPALVEYARIAARDKQNRYAKEVSQALEVLSKRNTTQDRKTTGWILEILAAGQIPDTGQVADIYLDVSNLANRLLAAYLAATRGGDREKALQIISDTLANEKFANPKEQIYLDKAAGYLKSINCRNDKEKQEREKLLLQQLGKATESYAMRVLPTCCGDETAEKLLPILDDDDVKRAVYAAWVLAQHPDEQVRKKGLRRLAIYAIFHHSVYQAGAGIDFSIARNISFHQDTVNMRRSQKLSGMIPRELLQPFELNEREQEFSIRAYRFTRFKNHQQHMYGFEEYSGWPTPWTTSHLPLLRVIAREDPRLTVFHVQGKLVPHFPHRRHATQAIARLTGRKATYFDLSGAQLDSETVPQPYENQNNMIARYILDLIEQANVLGPAESDAEWNRSQAYEFQIRQLIGYGDRQAFGNELKQALILESERRGKKEQLIKANFSIWRDLTK